MLGGIKRRLIVLTSSSWLTTLIAESPSLRPRVAEWVAGAHAGAARAVLRNLSRHDELDHALAARIDARRYSADEVMRDWWPPAQES